jgi:hypothetical protein
MDDTFCFDDPLSGQTTMHAFSDLIQDLSALHNEIVKNKAVRASKNLRETSVALFRLQLKIKGEACRIKRQEMQEEILRLQHILKTDIEAKDTASRMRISNFYKTGIGKMQPETFYCIKNPNRSRDINSLRHDGIVVTDPDQIVATMQAWYERTAERALPQTETLTDFLTRHHTDLPQIEEDQKEALEEEFSVDEVKHAIKDAHEVSAPGPSGQTIAFYKLLFLTMPNMMTRALNQLVFLPRLSEDEQLRWVQQRKVIYIPKIPLPSTPSDYRPLSMLEVLYKIPSRILAARLNRILPTIIGPHQHGFMTQKGIQEPSLLATHLIQDATHYQKPLQLVSFDMEKAFDRVGHAIIIQALRAFGVPEIMVQAISQYTLVGYAYVEVNGRRGILITIKTGSGQGDPLSSILFLISTEPLNRILCSSFLELMYVAEDNVTVGPILYADDNLTPLSLQRAEQIHSILEVYDQYTGVSGLNVNVSKTTALCINTSGDVREGLEQAGLALTNTAKHLGIHLAPTIEATVEATMAAIDPKAIERRILATTPPTDMLHRALLVNIAFTPIYNHVFMALPITSNYTDELQKAILKLLWTRQLEGQTKQKRRLVARNRLGAGLAMGGLGIQPIENTVEGFQQNLLQRIYKRVNQTASTSLLPSLLNRLLVRVHRPSLEDHVERLGPQQWETTAARLEQKNKMFAQAFRAVSALLRLYEVDKDGWHHAPIFGHTKASLLYPFTRAEAELLWGWDIIVVSQLFNTNELTGMLDRSENDMLAGRLQQYPLLRHKLHLLTGQLRNRNFLDKTSVAVSTLALLFRKDYNISQTYKKIIRHNLHQAMGTPPAFGTRERDGVYVPERQTFVDSFRVLSLPFMSSKTKEVAFQILNRTVWTNNKSFKSGLIDSPLCLRCEEVETMEHLLYLCPNYAEKLWIELGLALTQSIAQFSQEYTARIDLTPKEIVYNKPHPAILLRITDKLTQYCILVLVQEVKRNIIFRRMQLSEPVRQEVPKVRLQAHLLSVIRKLTSLLEYQGIVQNNVPISFLSTLNDTLISLVQ